jgi:hypothetical protein
MIRFLFRTVDFGASIVFVALCAKAFCVHFYEDLRRHPNSRDPSATGRD